MVEQENYSKHSFRDGRACNFGGSSEKRIFSSLWAFHGTQASVGFEPPKLAIVSKVFVWFSNSFKPKQTPPNYA
jgi:hypothetical protein